MDRPRKSARNRRTNEVNDVLPVSVSLKQGAFAGSSACRCRSFGCVKFIIVIDNWQSFCHDTYILTFFLANLAIMMSNPALSTASQGLFISTCHPNGSYSAFDMDI